jgi:hypothetical protein
MEIGCNSKFKTNNHLKRHILYNHTDDKDIKKWFKCSILNCNSKFKTNNHLKRHILYKHTDDEDIKKWFKCSILNCNSKFKTLTELNNHVLFCHTDDTNIQFWYHCNQTDCEYESKSNGNLQRHLWCEHSIGNRKIYKCNQNNCEFETKTNCNLKQHLQNVHDQGNELCEILNHNVFKLTKYYDDKVKKDINMCRTCYHKVTGFTSRKELQMVEYLKNSKRIGPYIVFNDKIIKGESCDTKRRPDLLISSTHELQIIVECDEYQHKDNNYSCETGRMDEILDELTKGRTIFIRWNPDKFKVNDINVTVLRDDRLKKLKDLIIKLINKKDWDDDETVKVYYMFYSADNPNITKRLNKEMIY